MKRPVNDRCDWCNRTAVSQNYGLVSGVLIMPTDLDAVTGARKRKAQALPPTSAARLCDASFGNIFRWGDDALRLVATYNTPPAFVEPQFGPVCA